MNERDVIELISIGLEVPVADLSLESVADDFPEWDSMGTFMILTELDKQGISVDPGDVGNLQSVHGVLETVRRAGKLTV